MRTLLLSGLLLIAQYVSGQQQHQFSRVKDISPLNQGQGGTPTQIVICNDKLFFAAYSPDYNFEIWVSDGTEAGTHITRDVNPTGSYGPAYLTVLKDKVFFVQYHPETGRELYVTDGTFDGTKLVKDINPGAAHSYPYDLTAYNGKLYFVAASAANGRELWVTDGTEAGTNMVKDLSTSTVMSWGPHSLTVASGKLFFTSNAGGDPFYVSDGTAAGTIKLVDFSNNIAPNGGTALILKECDGKIYFSVRLPSTMAEAWVSDGTSSGTFKLMDLSRFTGLGTICALNGKVYFIASGIGTGNELWVTDGTSTGTQLVKDIMTATGNGIPNTFVNNLIAFNGRLYFAADDGTGLRLWATDGTSNGTVKVHPDEEPGYGSFYVYNGKLYFVNVQNKLMVTDGTAAGTKELKSEILGMDMQRGSSVMLYKDFYEFFGKLYFFASSNDPVRSQYGYQMWQSDGTDVGTYMLLPNPVPASSACGPSEQEVVNLGNELFLSARYDYLDGYELWKMGIFPTSVNNQVVASTQYIYPNPTTGTISIQLPVAKDASVKIYSLTGQLMLQQNISAKNMSIDVSMLSPGMYLTHIITDGQTTVEKLVKQ